MSLQVLFGVFPSPVADDLPDTVRHVRLAEDCGLDLVGVQDHPYQRRFLDTFALLPYLMAVTTTIRFFPDVTHLPLRPPAMLAKQAATLDVLSGGRFELGIGSGGFDQASQAMGAQPRTGKEKLEALREAVEICRLFWSAPEHGIRYEGLHYRLDGTKAGPAPVHDIGVWVGGIGPRTLQFIGERADGWVPSSPFVPPDRLRTARRRVDEAAEAVGRDPSEVRTIYNVNGTITAGVATGWLQGPVEHWVDELTSLAVEDGVSGFVYWPGEQPDDGVRAWAEVAAGVRERLARPST